MVNYHYIDHIILGFKYDQQFTILPHLWVCDLSEVNGYNLRNIDIQSSIVYQEEKKGGERIIGEIGSYIRNCSRDLLMCQLAC